MLLFAFYGPFTRHTKAAEAIRSLQNVASKVLNLVLRSAGLVVGGLPESFATVGT